jgi:transcription-repair coupling factor (superfamily II helicase)
MIGDKDVLFYPGSYRRPYQIEDTDNANVLLRAEVLNRINSQETGYCDLSHLKSSYP